MQETKFAMVLLEIRVCLLGTLYLRKHDICKLLEAGSIFEGRIFAISSLTTLQPSCWHLNKEGGLDGPLVYPRMVTL